MDYFNATDREFNLTLIIMAQHFEAWCNKNKRLTAEEKKYIRMGCSFLMKAGKAMINRSKPSYQRAILNQANVATLVLHNEYKQVDGSKYVDTVNLVKDDFLDLAEYASWKCNECNCKDFTKCRQFNTFIRLNVPLANENSDSCPYKL